MIKYVENHFAKGALLGAGNVMFDGKLKALTFSYDDGVTRDERLAALFHKYGMKATKRCFWENE